MKKYAILSVLSLVALPVWAQICITHATVVNVNTRKSDPDQTIIIDHDRITAIGPSRKVKIPANAAIIDATGKYIMPGLTDAHIHFFQSGGLYTRPDAVNLNAVHPYSLDQQYVQDNLGDLMSRYLACGITTVVDVGGPLSNFKIRDTAATSPAFANAWVTGPLVSTYLPPNLDKKDPPIIKVDTPEEARELVKKQLPYKPDFIKIWYVVLPGQKAESTLPMVKAAIEESHSHGLKVAVHATEYETAKLAVTAGADILVHSVDDKMLDKEMLQLLKDKKTVYIPTLIVHQNYIRTFTQQFNFSAHDFAYADPTALGSLTDLQHIAADKSPIDYKRLRSRFSIPSADDSMMLVNLGLAQKAGINIVSGTDAGNIGTFHASSLYPELLTMSRAGLSNWDVLCSSTINAAKGFGKDKDYGSLEAGKIADLLLLSHDPVKDLTVLSDIDTVIHRGNILDPHTLIKNTALSVVQQQVNAYNAHNLDAFLSSYSDSVELYDQATNALIVKGKSNMRTNYLKYFEQSPELHCEIANRIFIAPNIIIDHEKITGIKGRKDDKPLEAAAIYTIGKDNKINRVYFLP